MKKILFLAVLAVLAVPLNGVDYEDFRGFVNVWLCEVNSSNEYNLCMIDDVNGVGIVNFRDFALFNFGVIKCPPCEQNQIETLMEGGANPKCCMECLKYLPYILYARVTDPLFEPIKCYMGPITDFYNQGEYNNYLPCVYPEGCTDKMFLAVRFCMYDNGDLEAAAYFGNCHCFGATIYANHCYCPP
ncbi:MAG: hypothetical protein KJ941_01010, partial [Bacteroidetes bacterium]|nr:hypothetical protein [Bacteroidota bacterium]